MPFGVWNSTRSRGSWRNISLHSLTLCCKISTPLACFVSPALRVHPATDGRHASVPTESNPHPLSQTARKKGGATGVDEFLLLLARVFVDRAAFHHEIYVLQHLHIRQRVLAYCNDVGVLSWFDGAYVALAADQVGGA